MKKIIFFFLSFIFLTALAGFGWWQWVKAPIRPQSQETQIFVVPQGWGAGQIGQELQKESLIKNDLAFQLIVWQKQIGSKLQAGDYRLSQAMKLDEIINALTSGTLDVWVTIQEGLRKEEAALLIQKAFAQQEADFDVLAFAQQSKNLEGYLFPDTYLIPKEASPSTVIKMLQGNFEKKYASLNNQTTLTKKQVVILASIVEREARHDNDRQVVAGILLKRMRKGKALEVDATAQYIKASNQCGLTDPDCDWWPTVYSQDLEVVSAYNTYDNLGLPPTAICNPSLSALSAVVNAQDSDDWFYLSDPSGTMHYSKTFEEHEANIAKYLQ
jgi:UPF0755 protein